jgi:lysophospholipid acyltransferase (LPLAT)-like uncharacterized protein
VRTQRSLKQRIRAVRRRPGYARVEAALLGPLIWCLLWFLRLTSRFQLDGAERLLADWSNNTPVVLAFWHGRSIMLPFVLPPSTNARASGHDTYIMNSTHRDGEIITRALVRFGIRTTRGSTSRGAVAGTLGLMRALRGGATVALIPDGPRGPAGRAQAGAVELAATAGVSLYPVAFSATRHIRLTGWDRMMVPLPGARIVCTIGEPMRRDAGRLDKGTREQLRARLETQLIAVTRKADRLCGRPEEDA